MTADRPTLPNPYGDLLASVPVRTASLSVLGSTTHYWVYGDDDAAETMVAVHGFRGDHHGLEPVVANLAGLRIISPDLPGFGDSTPMTGPQHDVAGYAVWLDAFVAGLELSEPPVVLGHSFGSIIAAAAVAGGLSTPRLILVNPIAAPALKGPKAAMTALAVFYYSAGAKLPRRLGYAVLSSRVVTRIMSQVMVTTKSPSLRRWIHDQHRTYFSRFSDRDTMLTAFRASTANNVQEFAPKIAVPTLLIAAGDDPITTVADERRLRDQLADAQLHVLDGVGHLIHYERPREAAELIVSFLGAGRLA